MRRRLSSKRCSIFAGSDVIHISCQGIYVSADYKLIRYGFDQRPTAIWRVPSREVRFVCDDMHSISNQLACVVNNYCLAFDSGAASGIPAATDGELRGAKFEWGARLGYAIDAFVYHPVRRTYLAVHDDIPGMTEWTINGRKSTTQFHEFDVIPILHELLPSLYSANVYLSLYIHQHIYDLVVINTDRRSRRGVLSPAVRYKLNSGIISPSICHRPESPDIFVGANDSVYIVDLWHSSATCNITSIGPSMTTREKCMCIDTNLVTVYDRRGINLIDLRWGRVLEIEKTILRAWVAARDGRPTLFTSDFGYVWQFD